MKLKFKALAAAVALAAVAGQASALTQTDAILYIVDTANSSSFVMDLGAALPSSAINLSTAGGADWASFAGQASYAADLAAGNIQFGLFQAPATTTTFITSYANGATIANPASSANTVAINGIATTLTSAVAGTTAFTTTGGNNNWNTIAGPNLGAKVSFSTFNTLDANAFTATGDTASLQYFSYPSTRGSTPTNLASGTFTLAAAVPEPETYGMLAAGLLMLGAVARRRKV